MKRKQSATHGARWLITLLSLAPLACGGTDGTTTVAPSGPTSCDVYCGFMAMNCTRGHIQYDDNAGCLRTCEAFARSADPNDTNGDTLDCRMVYAVTADRPERHQTFCDNAGPSGGNDCRP